MSRLDSQWVAGWVRLWRSFIPPVKGFSGYFLTVCKILCFEATQSQAGVSISPHLCIEPLQRPVLELIRFKVFHVFLGRLKPIRAVFGSSTMFLLIVFDSVQTSIQWLSAFQESQFSLFFQNGILDFRLLGGKLFKNGQRSVFYNFATSCYFSMLCNSILLWGILMACPTFSMFNHLGRMLNPQVFELDYCRF